MNKTEVRVIGIDAALMVLFVAAAGIFQILWKDLVASAGGLGWDGYLYARVIQFPESVLQMIPGFAERKQRILPSLLLAVLLRWLNIERSDPKIILTFQVINLFLLISAIFAYLLISRQLAFRRATRWLGFFPLFFCFGTAKMPFFIPVGTDTIAFALSLWGVVFAFKRKAFALFAIMLLAAFTWSTLVYWLMPLLLFPLRRDDQPEVTEAASNFVLPLAVSSLYLVCVFVSYNILQYTSAPYGAPMLQESIPLSEAIGALYLYLGFYCLAPYLSLQKLPNYFKQVSVKGVVLAITVIVISRFCLLYFLNDPGGLPLVAVLKGSNSIFVRSIAAPGIFLVSHVVFYGPIFLVMLFFWKDISAEASRFGLGGLLFFCLTLFFSITSESRHLIHAYPFLVALTLSAVQKRNLENVLLPVIAVGSLLSSKIWWRITLEMHQEYVQWGFLNGPLQRYFMHQGPWMTERNYLLQGCLGLICAGIIYLCIRIGTPKVQHATA